jgi:lipoprotein-anchoring transpeptidase ErfK/SrfK
VADTPVAQQPGPGPHLRHRRLRIAGAIAFSVLATLTACGQAGATPRLQAIAVTDAPTEPATPDPTPTEAQTPTTPVIDPPAVAAPACPEGPHQVEIETALARIGTYGRITVDGVQTADDCAVVIAFQTRMGIRPNNGVPGPTTMDVANRIADTDVTQCPVSENPVACVDLTNQTFYIAQAGSVVLGPTVTRTGMPGWATPSGTFRIANRARTEWSVPFMVWMPYWQRFYDGDGLHETTTYIHDMWNGSHGCVNLLHGDAVKSYEVLGVGSTVHLYGRRPGT